MLVLTRKAGEQLVIGDNIRVTVVSVGPGRVKIGIEAPNWVKVDRSEIYDRKQAEQTEQPLTLAAETAPIVVEATQQVPTLERVATPAEPTEGPAKLENRLKGIRRMPRKPR